MSVVRAAGDIRTVDLVRALEDFGRIRLSINFHELFTTLIFNGLLRPYLSGSQFIIPPGYTLRLEYPVPLYKVTAAVEFRFTVDTDHALELRYFIDDNEVLYDSDVVQQNYLQPINFFALGAIIPARKKFTVELRNKTSNIVTVNATVAYGEVDETVFRNIIRRYFEIVLSEVEKRAR